MEEPNHELSSLETERQRLAEEMNIVSQTEGFPLLTERQQRLLKQALYVQKRTERGHELEYKLSEEHVKNWNCYGSIVNLEQERGLDIIRPETPADFFVASYEKVASIEELIKMIEGSEFPLVLHVVDTPEGGSAHTWHSCLVLGHDNSGKIMVWEKQSMTGPYHVTTLEEVYNYYKNYHGVHWGVRKLSSA